jgi:hypothetical protein
MKDHSAGLVVGLVGGIATTGLFNQLGHAGDWTSPAKYLEAEGFVYGALAVVAGYVLTRFLIVLYRMKPATFALGILLGLVGLLTLWWNVAWRLSPFTLEGAWLWPLAIVPLVLSFLSFKRWRHLGEGGAIGARGQ